METSRRSVLKAGLASTAAVAGLSSLTTPTTAAATPIPQDPFTLGVASGDPWPDGFVLWTRLAINPLAEDGLGGMPTRSYAVQWQVATDERFHHVVRAGVAVARPEHAHSVHVTVEDLRPGREYWYRFRVDGRTSRVGRALTAPARGTTPRELAMSFVSCSQFEHGWFTAYRRLAEDRPDLVLHLGDYQYEYTKNTYVAPGGNVRDHDGPETTTLASYRQRHAQYKSDLDLQAAHAVAPWLVVWDDHEVDNNWADETPEKPEEGFLERRAAAFQAYYENMPLRASSKPRGIDMQLYRRVNGASWPRSTCSTPGSTATTRMRRRMPGLPGRRGPEAVHHGGAAGEVADRRVPRVGRTLGHPRPAGLWRSATTPKVRSNSPRWMPGTGMSPRATGSPAAGWTRGSATLSS